MSDSFNITVNDRQMQISLRNFSEKVQPGPLLNIAGAVMRSSIEQTFRGQGSPAGSWPALAPSTLKRGKGGVGRKILIQSGRLKNSLTYVTSGNTLTIGTNLVYAQIQQEGGVAGRRSPSTRRRLSHLIDQQFGFHGPMKWRRPIIPARPYLVFRPEDPQKIADAMERYLNTVAQEEGLQ